MFQVENITANEPEKSTAMKQYDPECTGKLIMWHKIVQNNCIHHEQTLSCIDPITVSIKFFCSECGSPVILYKPKSNARTARSTSV